MVNRTVSRARMAAQVLHAQLRTDFAHPVDIFGVVQQQGIWLASQPLDGGLYGFYLRQGDVTGIVLSKLDGSAKGGFVLAVQERTGIPVKLLGQGEDIGDLTGFTPHVFVSALVD